MNKEKEGKGRMRRGREERIGLGWRWRISHSLQTDRQADKNRQPSWKAAGEGDGEEDQRPVRGWAREERGRTTALCGCGV